MVDISDTLAPNSDQLDAVDLLGGPQTFTIVEVNKNSGDQPISITLAEFPRVWRPGKSMRRVLAACWGTDASAYAGRRVTLYCDPDVTFGKEKVGGTRISHLSHIDGPKAIPLLVSQGRSATFRVQPLVETTPPKATPVSTATLADLTDTLTRKGVPEAAWVSGANQIAGSSAATLEELSEEQAQVVLAALAQRPDVEETA